MVATDDSLCPSSVAALRDTIIPTQDGVVAVTTKARTTLGTSAYSLSHDDDGNKLMMMS